MPIPSSPPLRTRAGWRLPTRRFSPSAGRTPSSTHRLSCANMRRPRRSWSSATRSRKFSPASRGRMRPFCATSISLRRRKSRSPARSGTTFAGRISCSPASPPCSLPAAGTTGDSNGNSARTRPFFGCSPPSLRDGRGRCARGASSGGCSFTLRAAPCARRG